MRSTNRLQFSGRGVMIGNLMPIPTIPQPIVPSQPHRLPVLTPCTFCKAKRFPYELPRFCCGKGDISLYPVTIPDELRQLYSGLTPESAHFVKFILLYNTAFFFTSTGVHLDPEFAKRTPFRAQGQIYHYINSLFPPDGTPSHLQLYFYDTEHEAANRRSTRDKLELPIINHLISVLETNPYSKFFRSLRER